MTSGNVPADFDKVQYIEVTRELGPIKPGLIFHVSYNRECLLLKHNSPFSFTMYDFRLKEKVVTNYRNASFLKSGKTFVLFSIDKNIVIEREKSW